MDAQAYRTRIDGSPARHGSPRRQTAPAVSGPRPLEFAVVPNAPEPDEGAQRRAQRSAAATVLRLVGLLVALGAVAFCVKTLVDEWSTIGPSIADASPSWIMLALALGALSMTGLGVLWWRCLALFGERRTAGTAISWYYGGELGKYLPGGIWPVVGRGELAYRGGIGRSVGYTTTLISYGTMCVGAGLVCGVLAPVAAADGRGLGWGWALLALVPIGLIVVHPAVFGRLLALGRRLTNGRLTLESRPWPDMLRLIAWSVPAWVFLGGTSAAVTHALGYQGEVPRIAFAAVAAWIIGFLAVPVPAGAGLREVVFIALSGLPTAQATAVAATARVLLIVVDGAGGVLGLWSAHVAGRRTISGSPDKSDGPDGPLPVSSVAAPQPGGVHGPH